MTRSRSGNTRLLVRVAIYLVVVAVLYHVRGGVDWRHFMHRIPGFATADSTFILAGSDLAPELVRHLKAHYRRDYPELDIRIQDGGSSHALEALVNGRADVAFLNRQPSPREQELFRSVDGDTALWYPIALGGILLIQGEKRTISSLSLDDLRHFLRGERELHCDHFYVPDPNLGLWDAFLSSLDMPLEVSTAETRVIFLKDETEVLAAVQNDKFSLGLISSLTSTVDWAQSSVGSVSIQTTAGQKPIPATYENVASGDYPLFHYLYVSCRSRGGIQGTKFVTHVTSDRGQRQIERAGFLPARLVLREIYLTKHPIGQ